MSLQKEAYQLYDKVWTSPSREEVKNIIRKLKPSTFGYGNKMYPSQFLGLLLLNLKQMGFAVKAPLELIAAWGEHEQQILFGVHESMIRLNQLCLAPLTKTLPKCARAVNPYREFPHNEISVSPKEILFTQTDAETFASSFHKHPAIEIALANASAVIENPLEFNYDAAVCELTQEMTEAGPRGNPESVERFKESVDQDLPSVRLFRHIGALVCIRDSLANLNQLIYQAVFCEKLTELVEDNIIKFSASLPRGGIGISVMYQRYGDAFLIEPTDLVLLSCKTALGVLDKHLCRVETQHDPSWDSSRPAYFELRGVDENLNAFGTLLR